MPGETGTTPPLDRLSTGFAEDITDWSTSHTSVLVVMTNGRLAVGECGNPGRR
jgi:hypothetical protein